MNFLFDQKRILSNILVSVFTTIILLVGFSLGVLYSENKENAKMSHEMPPLTNPLPLPSANENSSRGIPEEFNNNVPISLPSSSNFKSPRLMHTVYHPLPSEYPKNHTIDFTLFVIYVNDGANPPLENLVSENSDWNRCGSTVLKNGYSQMGFLLTGEPLSQKKTRLLRAIPAQPKQQ